MSKVNGEHEWARAPPPALPIWRRLTNILYNPEEKSVFGRTPKRWGIVLTFYMVFYAVLAMLFSACMGGLYLTLDPKTPSYTLDKSLIGNNPGVAYRPIAKNLGFVVALNLANSSTVDHYVNELTEFLTPYQKSKQYQFDECNVADNFGYPESPCFFIKLNKIFGWKPDCYDASELPQDMGSEVQELIQAEQGPRTKKIWMSCWEEKSNLTKIEYPWGVGLSADNYPFQNDQHYLGPLLAVRITPPANKQVSIRCRFWAKNIVYNKSLKEPSGYTLIQVVISNETASN